VTSENTPNYPPEAYAPNGILWWKLDRRPHSAQPYGAELKICAWLAYNISEGGTVTMRELRAALGDDVVPNNDEHLNRRLRELRQRDGWVLPSNKDDGNLPVGTYRVDVVGWHPGLGTPRAPKNAISQAVRRRVFERDGSRCVVCGVGNGEEYPGEPGSKGVLTVGHIVANDHGGSSDMNNLRAECKRCNEPVRQEIRSPETLQQVLPDVRGMKREEKQRLLSWLRAGQRTRDKLDAVYDRARKLTPEERADLEAKLQVMVGTSGS
jgi:hypothetical protein